MSDTKVKVDLSFTRNLGNYESIKIGIGIEDLRELTTALLRSGAPIEEMNVVRKHLSAIQGGHLARIAVEQGAQVDAFIISDVTGDKPVEHKGYVPPRSVVIPGSYTKEFKAGNYQVPCALIIGQRKASTDLKTSLNDSLRDYDVAV